MNSIPTVFIRILFVMVPFYGVAQQNEPVDPGVAGILPTASRTSLSDHIIRPYMFADTAFYHWGGTPIKGDDGLYHIFYDRWPRSNPRGMFGWLYITEIAHATSKKPEGPYRFHDVAISSAGDNPAGRWDAVNTHNAYITRFPNPKNGKLKYYLYFIANRGNQTISDPWMIHIANQRIGVASSDSPYGPWERYPEPVCVPGGPLQHYVVNPGVTRLPDGRYLMVLKGRAVVKDNPKAWGAMLHGWALADKPTGPFEIQNTLLFPAEISAEDPCVWVQGNYIYAAVKDWEGLLAKGKPGISWVYAEYKKGECLTWKIPQNASISARELKWQDGTETPVYAMERPYILLDKNGRPSHLFAACCWETEFIGSQSTAKTNYEAPLKNLPFNVCIPLVKPAK